MNIDFQLPRGIHHSIERNPHTVYYMTAEQWLQETIWADGEQDAELLAEIERTGELWWMQWYPDTPVGFCEVVAASLPDLLRLANEACGGVP